MFRTAIDSVRLVFSTCKCSTMRKKLTIATEMQGKYLTWPWIPNKVANNKLLYFQHVLPPAIPSEFWLHLHCLPISVIQIAIFSYMKFSIMMMTKLRQEAVTEVASWGVSNPLMGCRVWVFSMRLAKAAYTARRYTITAIMLAMIRDT